MKDFLSVVDIFVGTFWSITMVEVVPAVFSGQIVSELFTSASGIVNLLLAIAGLIYLVFRIIHFVAISKINIDIKKEELTSKKHQNFYNKFNEEFIKGKE